jgi:hypothetical protein
MDQAGYCSNSQRPASRARIAPETRPESPYSIPPLTHDRGVTYMLTVRLLRNRNHDAV